jgi:hypothetical protein
VAAGSNTIKHDFLARQSLVVTEDGCRQEHLPPEFSRRGKNMAKNRKSHITDRWIRVTVRIVGTVVGAAAVDLVSNVLGQYLASAISNMMIHPVAPCLWTVIAITVVA